MSQMVACPLGPRCLTGNKYHQQGSQSLKNCQQVGQGHERSYNRISAVSDFVSEEFMDTDMVDPDSGELDGDTPINKIDFSNYSPSDPWAYYREYGTTPEGPSSTRMFVEDGTLVYEEQWDNNPMGLTLECVELPDGSSINEYDLPDTLSENYEWLEDAEDIFQEEMKEYLSQTGSSVYVQPLEHDYEEWFIANSYDLDKQGHLTMKDLWNHPGITTAHNAFNYRTPDEVTEKVKQRISEETNLSGVYETARSLQDSPLGDDAEYEDIAAVMSLSRELAEGDTPDYEGVASRIISVRGDDESATREKAAEYYLEYEGDGEVVIGHDKDHGWYSYIHE